MMLWKEKIDFWEVENALDKFDPCGRPGTFPAIFRRAFLIITGKIPGGVGNRKD